MDSKTKAFILEKEEEVAQLGSRLAKAEQERDEAVRRLEENADLAAAGTKAHRDDIDEITEYQQENAKLIEALQEIADGRGKFSKIAKKALGQVR